MIYKLGILLAAIFAALSSLHVYWALGGSWGSNVAVPSVGGTRAFNPTPMQTILVAAALLVAMLTILGKLGIWRGVLPGWMFFWGTCGISLIFFLRAVGNFRSFGFFKQVSDSGFAHWDTWLYSPLCVFISATALMVAFRNPQG
jgi:hypothetical protein